MVVVEVIVVSLFVAACSVLGIGVCATYKDSQEQERKCRELEDRMMERYGWCPSSSYYDRPFMY